MRTIVILQRLLHCRYGGNAGNALRATRTPVRQRILQYGRNPNARFSLVALTAILCAAALAGTAESGETLAALHANAKAHRAECASCHGDRKHEVGTDRKTRSSHSLHLSSPLLRFQCVDCHQSVDLAQASAANLRKQVSPELCASCHSGWPATKMHTEKTKAMCVSCHPHWREQMKDSAPYVALDKVTAKDCYGCHGGRTLYVKPATHERAGGQPHGH